MKSIGNIYLTWRKSKGERRIAIGVIKKNSTEGVRFHYIKENLKEARNLGFSIYEGFPEEDKTYNNNVIEVFGQRLMQSERNDLKEFYKFWLIDQTFKNDYYYMLAFTQGMLPTDNYEFLAVFNPIENLSFITEIAGLSKVKISNDALKVGDVLSYERESNNEYDEYAVKIFKDDLQIGYIKTIHNRVFYKSKSLKVTVHHIEKNGFLNRVFLRIDSE